jgi:hypothetical protein
MDGHAIHFHNQIGAAGELVRRPRTPATSTSGAVLLNPKVKTEREAKAKTERALARAWDKGYRLCTEPIRDQEKIAAAARDYLRADHADAEQEDRLREAVEASEEDAITEAEARAAKARADASEYLTAASVCLDEDAEAKALVAVLRDNNEARRWGGAPSPDRFLVGGSTVETLIAQLGPPRRRVLVTPHELDKLKRGDDAITVEGESVPEDAEVRVTYARQDA